MDPLTAWEPCPGGCGEFWCNLHGEHVYDCQCPETSLWPVDPYVATLDEAREALKTIPTEEVE